MYLSVMVVVVETRERDQREKGEVEQEVRLSESHVFGRRCT